MWDIYCMYTDHINLPLFSETDIGLAIDAAPNAILVGGDFSLDFLQFWTVFLQDK